MKRYKYYILSLAVLCSFSACDSLLNEVELMQIVDTVFTRLGIRVCIKINNRKILTGIAEIIGEADKIVDITVAIDKLDKIGLDNVNAELKEKGISDEAIAKLQPIILLNGTNEEKLATLKEVLAGSEIGQKGVEESEFILKTLSVFGLKNELELDLTLARGLNYYTGAIFEVKALDVQIGSIIGILPSRSNATCPASVGLGFPEVFALGAAIIQPLSSISASATG